MTMISLVSCSNPTSKKYNEATLAEDIKAIGESKKWTEDEAKMFAGWMLKAKLTGQDLTTKTYQNILDEAKNYKREQEELAEKAKKEEEARAERMKTAAIISIYGYEFREGNRNDFDYNDYNLFKYAVKNKTNKEIKAMKFHFKIYNALGDQIGTDYTMSLTDDRIAPSSDFQNIMAFDYNQFDNDDVTLRSANFKDLTFDIKVDKIVYTDGSVLE